MKIVLTAIHAAVASIALSIAHGAPGDNSLGLHSEGRERGTPGDSKSVRHVVSSPDGLVELSFVLGPKGEPRYQVSYRKEEILAIGNLGFLLNEGPLNQDFRVAEFNRRSKDDRWRPVAGERAEIRDLYNALELRLIDRQSPSKQLDIEFRAYNQGAAFRYRFGTSGAAALTVTNELTEFAFGGDYSCWQVYSAQGVYAQRPVSQMKPGCERPLTVELPNGRWAAIGEAGLVDFARMKFRAAGQVVRAHLDGPVTVQGGTTSPWRFVIVADSAGQLIERNDLVMNLNEPCAIADASWIKPGTVIRESSLTTEGGKACVDFAARMGIRYVEYDAGWYGPEEKDESDARAVNLDARRSKGPLDLHEVIRYANEKDVGIILYVNRRALEKQLDEILPLYRKWGVKGVKYGFVNVGSQRWTAWLHEAVIKAADHRLIVDIHDEYRPTGWSRTWPNLLTQEGIRGNEEMPTAEHNLILPFTRFLCGPADYTFCWNDKRLKTTRPHQLAASVVFFSPLQFLFWYDRPGQIADEPALEFWRSLPTTWDNTRVLEGRPGEYATVARRKGDSWYLGSMNGPNQRLVEVRLDFLDDGKTYDALICTDTAPGETTTRAHVERKVARKGDVLRAIAAPNGGCAVRLSAR